MKGKELYEKSLLERMFKALKKTPSIKFLQLINYIDNIEMDEFWTKDREDKERKKIATEVSLLDRDEMEILNEVANIIVKNLERTVWKVYIEQKAGETIK